MNAISGAGYAEDIVATAATLYVGSFVGLFAKGFTTGALKVVAGAGAASIAGTAAFYAVPLTVGALVLHANPGLQDALSSKFHSYFS